MEAISRLPHLQDLGLADAQLTDDAISELHRCQSLARVSLARESVSKGMITELQSALEGCQFRVSHPDQASPLNDASYREAIQRLIARGFKVGLITEKAGGISWIYGKVPFPAGDVVFAESVVGIADSNGPAVLQLDQSDVADLVQLKDLQAVNLNGLPTVGLQALLSLKNLTYFVVHHASFNEADCRQLASFRKLRHIGLKFPSDEALRIVAEFPNLTQLTIHYDSTLSKDCLKLLIDSKTLSHLHLTATFPKDAAQAFADARPDVSVRWDGAQIRPAANVTPDKSDVPSLGKAPFDAKQARAHQEAWAKHLGAEVETTNSVGQKMVLIPPGEFLMGSSDEDVAAALKAADAMRADRGVIGRIETSERPQHRVVISKPLRMSATEVTVGQFKRFVEASKYVTEAERYGFGDSTGMAPNNKVTETQRQSNWRSPGYAVDDNSPVAQITWNDAVAYCKWLSDQEKITYRLPTEAEWEYACRAGSTSQYSFGDDYKELPKYGWPIEGTVIQSHAVGTLEPNNFGLFDMHGNLYEWCNDYFDANWYGSSSTNDPAGPASGSNRVLRGGSIHNGPSQCRSASRYSNSPSGRFKDYGFRCVAELQLPTVAAPTTLKFASDEWIDVMPLLSPELDKVDIGRSLIGKNDWRIEDGELRYYGDEKSGKLYFPVRCLGRSMEWEFEFTRTVGDISFNTDIPIPGGFVPLTIGNDKIGFINESLTDKFLIVNKERTKLRLRVTHVGADDRLEVFVNDKPLVDWTGPLAKHKIEPPQTDPRSPSEHISLFTHGPTNYSFRAIRMRMLNGGTAEPLRPTELPSR